MSTQRITIAASVIISASVPLLVVAADYGATNQRLLSVESARDRQQDISDIQADAITRLRAGLEANTAILQRIEKGMYRIEDEVKGMRDAR